MSAGSPINHTVFSPSTQTTTRDTMNSTRPTNPTDAKVNSNLQNAKDTVVDNAAAAYNAVASHPVTQSVTNGPVAENARDQAQKTQNEFSNLAAARTTPAQPAATGQQLTHYHSFFSSLLSWENPRASAIAYASIVLFIFGARYLNLLRYAFKLTWMTLGVTVLAEIAGKTMFSQGFTSQIRPRKYYVLPKETLDSMIGDVHELVNFFIIESQRIVFAENVFASLAAFLGAFVSYYLIKIVPLWGLALIGTSVAFMVPLLYTSNQELIDHHIRNASNVMNQQAVQVKQVASHHASVAANTTKQYASDYTAKAQEIVGISRARSQSPTATTKPETAKPLKTGSTNGAFNPSNSAPAYQSSDFPAAPKDQFKTASTTAPTIGTTSSTLRDPNEPLIAT